MTIGYFFKLSAPYFVLGSYPPTAPYLFSEKEILFVTKASLELQTDLWLALLLVSWLLPSTTATVLTCDHGYHLLGRLMILNMKKILQT